MSDRRSCGVSTPTCPPLPSFSRRLALTGRDFSHNLSQDELPYIKIPLHTVIKLTPKAYGCDETRYSIPIEAVDTTRCVFSLVGGSCG